MMDTAVFSPHLLRSALVALFAMLIAQGCGAPDELGGETPDLDCDGSVECAPNECTENADCTDGSCADNECVPYECTENADCADGFCADNECVPYECTEDDGCTDGFCDENKCVPYRCTEDDDCTDGFCDENECVLYECTEDDGCTDGFCDENKCVPYKCTEDGDCNDGEVCAANICVPYECTEDEDCDDGLCAENECVPYECTENADCVETVCQAGRCAVGLVCKVGIDIESIEEGISRSECEMIGLPSGDFEISEISIDRDLVIYGFGPEPSVLDANENSRHFTIESDRSLHLDNVVLRNGFAERGGSILAGANASLRLAHSIVEDNTATREGGAIAFPYGGSVHIDNCDIRRNRVQYSGVLPLSGGAISIENGDITIKFSSFYHNSLEGHIPDDAENTPATINALHGGALFVSSNATDKTSSLDIESTNFENNKINLSSAYAYTTFSYGGAIYAKQTDIMGSNVGFIENSIPMDSDCELCSPRGGAIYHNRGTINLSQFKIKNNYISHAYGTQLIRGGALYTHNISSLIMQDGIFKENSVRDGSNRSGGAIYTFHGDADIPEPQHQFIDVLFDGNSAVCEDENCATNDGATGGAMSYQLNSGAMQLLLERVVGINNRVDATSNLTAGAFAAFTSQATMDGSIHARFVNSTFSGNTSSSGASVLYYVPDSLTAASTVEFLNSTVHTEGSRTVFSLNARPDAEVEHILRLRNSILSAVGNPCTMAGKIRFESAGWLVRPEVGSLCSLEAHPSDIITYDPGLLPLGDYGGETLTHALAPENPLVGAGEPGGCTTDGVTPILEDQRGHTRSTPNCTPGAYSD